MSYTLITDESLTEAVRRVAAEQLDAAIDDLAVEITNDPARAIHDARKRCKKVRGLVRAVRPSLGKRVYQVANDTARDAARELSDLRDATAMVETFRLAVEHGGLDEDDESVGPAIESVERMLTERQLAAEAQLDVDHPRVERAREMLMGMRATSSTWDLDADGWVAIAGGARKTYKRGRRALSVAADAPTGQNFHEWRKRVKYTWYHLRLVDDMAPAVLAPLTDAFHDLSDALGDAHDMVVLTDTLATIDDGPDQRPVEQLLGGLRSTLEHRALALGARLYAESKSAFVDRLGAYWSAEERFGPERPVGGIDALR